MRNYTTIQGDTWDIIAYKTCGNEMCMDRLIKANLDYKDVFIFSAGIILTIPEIELQISTSLPPWKQGVIANE